MTTSVNLEEVAALAAQLPWTDRLRLVERIVHELAVPPVEGQAATRADWMSLRGIAPSWKRGRGSLYCKKRPPSPFPFVNIKPGRVGGLTPAVRIHDLCRDAGIPCWVGGMLESSTGAAICAALAMLDNFTYPADIFPSSRFYVEDLSDPPLELCRSAAGVPSVQAFHELPNPVPERLERLTVQRAVLA